MNIGCLFILLLGVLCLFAGYPIISYYTGNSLKTGGAYNLGGINGTGQVPLISNFPSLIDTDTPDSAKTRTGFDGNSDWELVFSDEFNKDGRTFFDGGESASACERQRASMSLLQIWTAADDQMTRSGLEWVCSLACALSCTSSLTDIHYWPTGDYEWYDPAGATTKDGNLVLTMNQQEIHDLNFRSGMLQSWNKMCFQYSVYFEVRVSLPGNPQVGGFWPGAWMMGNLGRPGFGATTEGTWPYTYDSCDIGTLPNQTNVAGTGPEDALTSGTDDGPISRYVPPAVRQVRC
jgi:beta-glucanase (GH16 family)